LTKKGHVRIFETRTLTNPLPFQNNKWLCGRKNEWAMVLRGVAKLRFKNGWLVNMKAGSSLFIRAGREHRVEWTKLRFKTIWLAIHF